MAHRIVILDRDGVINFDSPEYIKSPGEWADIPGSLDAIARLHQAGYLIYVATNQAGIARGKLTPEDLAAIHVKMLAGVTRAGGLISGITFCPHHPDDSCDCRKPKPGMLLKVCEQSLTDPADAFFVGDSEKDIDAAIAAGCTPVLVLTGNGKTTHHKRPDVRQVYADLSAFADSLLGDLSS